MVNALPKQGGAGLAMRASSTILAGPKTKEEVEMRKDLIALAALVLAGLACQTLSGGGNPNVSPSAVPSRQVLFQDDFSNTNSGWPAATDNEKSANYSSDGQYLMQALTPQQDVWAHPGQNFTDVSVEVDATKASGPDNNGFGVVCRFQDNDNFYYFMVSSDGYQVIGKYAAGTNKYLSAEKMQQTNAIRSGNEVNHIRGDCKGSTLTLYANGQQLSSVTDTSFTSGDVGLIVGTFDDPNVGVLFDNFAVYQP